MKTNMFCSLAIGLVLLLTALSIFNALPVAADEGRSPEAWARVRLDHVRKQKAGQLREYLDHIHAVAKRTVQDEVIARFFRVNLECHRALSLGEVPADLLETVSTIRAHFNQYYIQNYLPFYDFLFVDMAGDVFYTLRKETDLNSNLFNHDTEDPLGICLSERPDGERFVDFHEYGPSDEPAAFFIEPIRQDNEQIGWLVLQCSINKINMIFAWLRTLGKTGETFLVNQDGYMLTESNFEGSSTILTRHLDNRNIQAKFIALKGNRVVVDYRGCTALTSFEVVPFMGTRWLVVAKIDRAEVLTDHYMKYRWYYEARLGDYLDAHCPGTLHPMVPTEASGVIQRVDMDELIRACPGERIETFGVSTCTALVGANPGRCGYLAHISPKDALYGAEGSDLLGQMLMRIKTFDIRPCEMGDLSFVVAAPHRVSLAAIVRGLFEEGFFLSQIRLFYNPQARTAAVTYDCRADTIEVTWEMADGSGKRMQFMEDGILLSDIFSRLMEQEIFK